MENIEGKVHVLELKGSELQRFDSVIIYISSFKVYILTAIVFHVGAF
jgi:hypothetical protein